MFKFGHTYIKNNLGIEYSPASNINISIDPAFIPSQELVSRYSNVSIDEKFYEIISILNKD